MSENKKHNLIFTIIVIIFLLFMTFIGSFIFVTQKDLTIGETSSLKGIVKSYGEEDYKFNIYLEKYNLRCSISQNYKKIFKLKDFYNEVSAGDEVELILEKTLLIDPGRQRRDSLDDVYVVAVKANDKDYLTLDDYNVGQRSFATNSGLLALLCFPGAVCLIYLTAKRKASASTFTRVLAFIIALFILGFKYIL